MKNRLIVWLIVTALLIGVPYSVFAQTAYNLGPGVNAPNTWTALQTFSVGTISPSLIGGTSTTSTLTLQSTSGVGASDAIIFKVGNNGATEAGRILNSGIVQFTAGGVRLGSSSTLSWGNAVDGGTPDVTISRASSTRITVSDNLMIGGSQFFIGGGGVQLYGNAAQLQFSVNGVVGGAFRNTGYLGLGGDFMPASTLDLRAGDLTFSGANGQKYVQGRATELVSVGSGLTTKATTIQIPADAIVYAVPVRVKTQPGGTTTFTVTATTSGTAFQKGANISTVAGTTDPGTKNTPVNYNAVAAQTITFTFNAATTDALGEIRVDIYYATSTPPTS